MKLRTWFQEVTSTLPTVSLVLAPVLGWWSLGFWLATVIVGARLVRDDKHNADLFERYYLFRTPWFRVFLHRMLSHDLSPYPHNHPWVWAKSLILFGGYLEERWHGAKFVGLLWTTTYHSYNTGDFNSLGEADFHRIDDVREGTWTLFMAGRRHQHWGFQTPRGFVLAKSEGRE